MAIDTAAKRRSAAGVPFLPLGPGVTPDTDKDAFWRQSAGWGYGGIAAAQSTTETRELTVGITHVLARDVTIFQVQSNTVKIVQTQAFPVELIED